jgi:hypothetical protein
MPKTQKTKNADLALTPEKINEMTVLFNELDNKRKIEKENKIMILKERIEIIKHNFNKNNNKINIYTILINNLDEIDENDDDKDKVKDELENKIQFILDTNGKLKNDVKNLKIELLDLDDDDLNEML